MQFQEALKNRFPDRELSPQQIDSLKYFYDAGFKHKQGLEGIKTDLIPKIRQAIEYFNEKTGKKIKCGKGNIQIMTPLAREYDLEEFKYVIDYAVESWTGTKFEPYIKITTLFGSAIKMDKYLACYDDMMAEKSQEEVITGKGDNGENDTSGHAPSF